MMSYEWNRATSFRDPSYVVPDPRVNVEPPFPQANIIGRQASFIDNEFLSDSLQNSPSSNLQSFDPNPKPQPSHVEEEFESQPRALAHRRGNSHGSKEYYQEKANRGRSTLPDFPLPMDPREHRSATSRHTASGPLPAHHPSGSNGHYSSSSGGPPLQNYRSASGKRYSSVPDASSQVEAHGSWETSKLAPEASERVRVHRHSQSLDSRVPIGPLEKALIRQASEREESRRLNGGGGSSGGPNPSWLTKQISERITGQQEFGVGQARLERQTSDRPTDQGRNGTVRRDSRLPQYVMGKSGMRRPPEGDRYRQGHGLGGSGPLQEELWEEASLEASRRSQGRPEARAVEKEVGRVHFPSLHRGGYYGQEEEEEEEEAEIVMAEPVYGHLAQPGFAEATEESRVQESVAKGGGGEEEEFERDMAKYRSKVKSRLVAMGLVEEPIAVQQGAAEAEGGEPPLPPLRRRSSLERRERRGGVEQEGVGGERREDRSRKGRESGLFSPEKEEAEGEGSGKSRSSRSSGTLSPEKKKREEEEEGWKKSRSHLKQFLELEMPSHVAPPAAQQVGSSRRSQKASAQLPPPYTAPLQDSTLTERKAESGKPLKSALKKSPVSFQKESTSMFERSISDPTLGQVERGSGAAEGPEAEMKGGEDMRNYRRSRTENSSSKAAEAQVALSSPESDKIINEPVGGVRVLSPRSKEEVNEEGDPGMFTRQVTLTRSGKKEKAGSEVVTGAGLSQTKSNPVSPLVQGDPQGGVQFHHFRSRSADTLAQSKPLKSALKSSSSLSFAASLTTEEKKLPSLPKPGEGTQLVQCQCCHSKLVVPPALQPSARGIQKLRCAKCRNVSVFSVPAPSPNEFRKHVSFVDAPPDVPKSEVSPLKAATSAAEKAKSIAETRGLSGEKAKAQVTTNGQRVFSELVKQAFKLGLKK